MKPMFALVLLAACHSSPTVAPTATVPKPAETHAEFVVTVTGHGPPIVFIPGLSSPGSVWDHAVAKFSATHECHVLTLAGFAGVPSLPGEATGFLARERDAIAAYVGRLDHPVVVGHSLGGVLAYAIATKTPVAGVVAVDGVPFMPALQDPAATPASVEPMAAQVRTMFGGLDAASFAKQTDAALAAMITSPDDVARVARDADKSDPKVVAEAVYDVMTTDLREDLAKVTAPVWLVQAAAGMPDEVSAAYETQLARAAKHHLIVAKTAKHFVMLDAPDVVEGAIAEATK